MLSILRLFLTYKKTPHGLTDSLYRKGKNFENSNPKGVKQYSYLHKLIKKLSPLFISVCHHRSDNHY